MDISNKKAVDTLNNQKRLLSIESKNIFSILKKWLYTEQDIVFRELISNASDAIEKRTTLEQQNGLEGTSPTPQISLTLDQENQRIIFSDNGIGMTESEVDRYINQIAFSGATDFINQQGETQAESIIGHFGVGFYSAFMIADHVAIETKSALPNAQAVRWDCLSDMSYEMKEGFKTDIGTDVILYLDPSSSYLQEPAKVFEIIKKYFQFLKTEIRLNAPGYDSVLINEPNPIWKRPVGQVTTEEMNTFYKEYYGDISDPLFFIPFESVDLGVKGIIFFRDTKHGAEELDGSFQVYNRGVYVGENIKKLIPKFVNLQSGIIDCTNLPLVVSRSTIRENESNNEMLHLIYETLVQEVTIALHNLFENRSEYERLWPHLNAFVKYAILQDKIFASVMTNKVIFQTIFGEYQTIREYLGEDRENTTVYYTADSIEQAHYIEIFKRCHQNALLFDHVIDQPFLRLQESVHPNVQFVRIDSNIESLFQGSLDEEDQLRVDSLTDMIHRAIGERFGNLELKITNLEEESISTLILHDETARRMADMLEMYGLIKGTDYNLKEMQSKSTFLINLNNDIVQFVLGSADESQADMILNQLFDLAMMSQGTFQPDEVEGFINRSETILKAYIQQK